MRGELPQFVNVNSDAAAVLQHPRLLPAGNRRVDHFEPPFLAGSPHVGWLAALGGFGGGHLIRPLAWPVPPSPVGVRGGSAGGGRGQFPLYTQTAPCCRSGESIQARSDKTHCAKLRLRTRRRTGIWPYTLPMPVRAPGRSGSDPPGLPFAIRRSRA